MLLTNLEYFIMYEWNSIFLKDLNIKSKMNFFDKTVSFWIINSFKKLEQSWNHFVSIVDIAFTVLNCSRTHMLHLTIPFIRFSVAWPLFSEHTHTWFTHTNVGRVGTHYGTTFVSYDLSHYRELHAMLPLILIIH